MWTPGRTDLRRRRGSNRTLTRTPKNFRRVTPTQPLETGVSRDRLPGVLDQVSHPTRLPQGTPGVGDKGYCRGTDGKTLQTSREWSDSKSPTPGTDETTRGRRDVGHGPTQHRSPLPRTPGFTTGLDSQDLGVLFRRGTHGHVVSHPTQVSRQILSWVLVVSGPVRK